MSESLEALVEGAGALGIELSDRQRAQFAGYAELLLEWNERINLLGPAAVQQLWTRHLLDALTLVKALPSGSEAPGFRLIDIGSGAGLPGIPLQIVHPEWEVTLLEATSKRARFLETACHHLGLSQTDVVAGRAEDVAHEKDYREAYDLCVARAVAHAGALVELTLPFVRVGGDAVLYKTLNGLADELEGAEPARVIVGASAPVVIPIDPGADGRCLVRYGKLRRTPSPVPRRAGVPELRPLTRADGERIAAFVAAEQERKALRRQQRKRRRR